MDILAALEGSAPTQRIGRCKVQRHLDSIPDDTAGKSDLLAVFEPNSGWSSPQLGQAMTKLGLGVSLTLIRQHRAGACPCYIGS
jgi:hypothetical protein